MSTLKDVDKTSVESLFDVVVNRVDGTREGWLMVGKDPLCILLADGLSKDEAEELISLAYCMAEPVNTLPI